MKKTTPSLCDSCPKPGICCKKFVIVHDKPPWAFTNVDNKFTVLKRLKQKKLPFIPIGKSKYRWVFSCPKLKYRRCSIYLNRPLLCKKYKAGTGSLCIKSKKFNLPIIESKI